MKCKKFGNAPKLKKILIRGAEGRSFHIRAATTGKARLVTVDSLKDDTTRRVVLTERRDRRPGWSATGMIERIFSKRTTAASLVTLVVF